MRALAGRRKLQVQRCSEPRVQADTPIVGLAPVVGTFGTRAPAAGRRLA